MAPLSRELASVVLPHEHFRSHLDSSGKTMDAQLGRRNFKHAGQALAEVKKLKQAASVVLRPHPMQASQFHNQQPVSYPHQFSAASQFYNQQPEHYQTYQTGAYQFQPMQAAPQVPHPMQASHHPVNAQP